MKTKQKHHQSGFTLIEVMVVVVILAILAAMIVPNIINKPDEAKVARAKIDVKQILNAVQMYKLSTGNLPQSISVLVPKELPQTPMDPWNHPYRYEICNIDGMQMPNIYTYGATNQPGGKGLNASVSSLSAKQLAQCNAQQ